VIASGTELRSIALAKNPAAMAKAMGMATEAGRLNLCAMNKPDFQSMSQKELQAYVLAKRNDQEAFHAYIDKLHREANWVEMPPLESLEDLENYPEFIEKIRSRSE